MFLGRWPQKLSLDTKNRLSMPGPLRASSMKSDGSSEFVVGVLEDPCLYLHTPEQHAQFNDRLKRRLGDTRQSRKVKTYIASRFVAVTTDANGRITIPGFLFEAAGIQKEVVVVAQETRAEVWGVEALKTLEDEVQSDMSVADALEQVFADEEAELRDAQRSHNAREGAASSPLIPGEEVPGRSTMGHPGLGS